MVLNSDPNSERIKKNEERINRSDDEVKENLLSQLREESVSIITLAYMYAKNFEETGADITQRWATMEQQNAILQQVYNKGFSEGRINGIKEIKEAYKKRGKK